MGTQVALEAEVFDERQVPLEAGAVRQPDEAAVELLALLLDRFVVPVNGALLEGEHARNRANETGLAAAVAALEHEQTAGLQRK